MCSLNEAYISDSAFQDRQYTYPYAILNLYSSGINPEIIALESDISKDKVLKIIGEEQGRGDNHNKGTSLTPKSKLKTFSVASSECQITVLVRLYSERYRSIQNALMKEGLAPSRFYNDYQI